jgi:hypothetical protein
MLTPSCFSSNHLFAASVWSALGKRMWPEFSKTSADQPPAYEGVPWARIGEQVGQRNIAITANVYSSSGRSFAVPGVLLASSWLMQLVRLRNMYLHRSQRTSGVGAGL